MVVEAWLIRAARARPDHAALETPSGSCSYAELLACARIGACELRARGAGPGQRVAIALPAGLAFAQALHACLLLGAVAVPVDGRLTAGERAAMAQGTAVQIEEPLSGVKDGEVDLAARVQDDLRSEHGHDLDATAIVIGTSGTTASPRQVELTYGNLLWSALGSAVALRADPGDRWLCTLPVSHIGGLSILLRSTIYATTAVVHERFDTERVLHALYERGVTLVSVVATTLSRLLDAGLQNPPQLRCALTGGGPVAASLLQRARTAGIPVSLTYGLTEACSQVTTTPLAALALEDPGPGPPLFCSRVAIASDGEILVAGPTVARASLDRDGWLHTGDEGALDGHGRLRVTGRKADTIITGGENVAPAEVEAVLEAHAGVLEAGVLGRPDPQWGEALTAIVVARPGCLLDGEALRAHCARSLASYKVPKRVLFSTKTLPRTPSGKLLRSELR